MHIVLLSDTHAPRFWKSVPAAVAAHLDRADVILHAGDVCTRDVLDDLSSFAPVHAVLGNNDGPDVARWGAKVTDQFVLEGISVAMVHDSGPRTGRLRRLRNRFPTADLVVFGHSHIPWDEAGSGLRILNPGSPTNRRRQVHGTLMTVDLVDGDLGRVRLVEVT